MLESLVDSVKHFYIIFDALYLPLTKGVFILQYKRHSKAVLSFKYRGGIHMGAAVIFATF